MGGAVLVKVGAGPTVVVVELPPPQAREKRTAGIRRARATNRRTWMNAEGPITAARYDGMNVLSTDEKMRVSGKTDHTWEGERSSIAQRLRIVCLCKGEASGQRKTAGVWPAVAEIRSDYFAAFAFTRALRRAL